MNALARARARRLVAALGFVGGVVISCGGEDDEATQEPASGGSTAGSGGTAGRGGTTGDGGMPGGGEGGRAGEAGGPVADCTRDDDCVPLNDCYAALCTNGTCVGSLLERGSECGDGFCNGFGRCLACLDDVSGTDEDLGCSADFPMCDELNSMPECVGCIGNSDCSDGVECTIDRCSDSECENVPLPSGSLCRGGFCNGDVDEHSCAPCLDDVSTGPDTGCTTDLPRCDTSVSPAECKKCAAASDCDDANDCTDEACNAGLCEHATLLGGTPCTYGYCNGIHGAEECVPRPCQTNPDCDDRAACTTDVCTSGFCVYTPDDGQCLDSGDVCGPNVCTVGTGCQAVDASRPIELLSNGNLDLGREDWLEMSAVYSGVIYPYDYIPTLFPHTRVYVAWLGNGEGGNDDANSLSQTVAVPEEAVRLELSFYYQVWADELPADQNQMEVRVRSTGASPPEELLFTLHNQDEVRVWKGVRLSIDTATWAGSDMVLELSGSSADGYTAFFVDSISLVATVCE